MSGTHQQVRDASLYYGDARDVVPDLDDVHLTVTSPPYLNAIDYGEHVDEGDTWYRVRGDADLDEFLTLQGSIFSDVLDTTVDGGFCAVVIAHTKTDDGEYVHLPGHFAGMMREVGWDFHERIIWNKVAGGKSTYGTTIQHPYPGYYYPNKMHEEIQIWRKGEPRKVRENESEFDPTTELMKRDVANNIWHIAPETLGTGIRDSHPCPYPAEIPYRLVKLYSGVGERVLDPMAGIATTAVAADALDRKSIMIDKREEYVESAAERLERESFERGEQLVPSVEKISP